MYLAILNSVDPYYNMATDEYFLTIKKIPLITIWRNDNAVIVGKNQNTLKEINNQYLNEHNIKVVRRISGGGAVFHDLGNINFSFFIPREKEKDFNFKYFLLPIQKILMDLGLDIEISGRNDLLLNGAKISGSAQYMTSDFLMHHGTILFSIDTFKATKVLNPNPLKLEAKGVDSVKSRITNIKKYLNQTKYKDLDVLEFINILATGFKNYYPTIIPYELSDEDKKIIQELTDNKYKTFEHNFQKNPSTNIFKEKYIKDFGYIEIHLLIKESSIEQIKIFGDFFSKISLDSFYDK
ncbi:MAG: lipoate--protein ligase, partial [Mycoplasma sp.]|nr:lipoate--protein ligase [Mycoplasma sp.]